jgi:hypothetical protein
MTTHVVTIDDKHNPIKKHVFLLYKDYHVAYNQVIGNGYFYSRFTRINRKHGYYPLLAERLGKKIPT